MITIYLDMDGVLADFHKTYYSGPFLEERANANRKWNRMRFRDQVMEHKIFENLDKCPSANKLLSYIDRISNLSFINIEILSSKGTFDEEQGKETVRQKMLWLEKHDINFKANFVRSKTEKADYATKYSILIDDSIGCIEPFIEKGGNAFLYVDSEVETTIHRLTHRIANLSTYQTIEP
jgi:hypothetical protein